MQDTNPGVIRQAAAETEADLIRWCEETNLLGTYRHVVRIETQYLADALHALRNGSPDVTEEFLDRAILALTRLRAE